MNEISFKPDYGLIGFLLKVIVIFILPIDAVLSLWFMVFNNPSVSLSGADGIMFALWVGLNPFLIGLFICYQYPREIVMTQSQAKLRKYIFPERFFNYNEFTSIDLTEIRFGRKAISLKGMKNGKELTSAFQKLIDEQKIRPGYMHKKLANEKSRTEQVAGYAGAFTILFLIAWYGIWYLFINDLRFFVNPELLGGIVFVVAYFGISLFLKYKHK